MDRIGGKRPSNDGLEAGDEGWEQQAGFSVFFDQRSSNPGTEWRTRLYHDEADDATSVLGLDPGGWMPWIVERLPANGQPRSLLAPRMVGVEVSGVKAFPAADDKADSGYFEIGLRIDGLSGLGQAVGAAVLAAALSALASSSATESMDKA
jgi:hypothetical protein